MALLNGMVENKKEILAERVMPNDILYFVLNRFSY